ncbi:MAG TPA: hypothetical protein PK020_08230 [Ilumatobacteraceae bacterium]|nr:hypothetical protein [Ilumatobacteraceae bacterium]HRB04777.1 hypothetical protein [Ilumatobacteraceae bacterium]
MIRRALAVGIAVAGLLSACSDDKVASPNVAGTLADGSQVADSPAPAPTNGGSAAQGGAVDCAAVTDAFGHAIVNIQVVAQLGGQPDVTQWVRDVGTMPEFGAQLDALAVLVPYDDGVAESLAFFKGANEIAARGYAGDAAAPAELMAYIGPDLTAVLSKQIPFSMAADAAGC